MADLGDRERERFLQETKPAEVEGVPIDWSALPTKGARDLRGMRFGKLIVKAFAYNRTRANGTNEVFWKCQCDCGNEHDVSRRKLVYEGTQSCGCLSAAGHKGLVKVQQKTQKKSNQIARIKAGLPPEPPTEVQGDPVCIFAHDSLLAYACFRWAGYMPAAHHQLIAKYLEKVESGEIKRLMIFQPPRSGKSMLVSEYFPAWFLGRNPDKRVVAASYGQELASDFGRKVRNQISDPVYGEIFPEVGLSGDSAAADKFDLNPPHQGGYVAVGVGGALTGRGAHCFSGETLVFTEDGAIEIATLVQLKYPPRVLSFNHDNNKLEFRRILAVQESLSNEFVEIRTSGGRSIRVTRDHVIYNSQRGYRSAEVFRPGDRLVSCEVEIKQDMREVRRGEEWPWFSMQELLQRGKKCSRSSEMREMRDYFLKVAMRIRETIKEKTRRFLLFSKMLSRTSCDKKSPPMQCLQQSGREERQEVLQWVQAKTTRKKNRISVSKNNLSNLQQRVFCKMARTRAREVRTVLQQKMLRIWAFFEYGWRKQSTLDSWAKLITASSLLYADVSSSASFGVNERQLYVRRLWREGKADACSSFGREANKQSGVKPGDSLHILSSENSYSNGFWAGYDEVASIVRVREDAVVYDIQVESNYNLFANGILCHNCLIIDDPIKGREDSDSEAHQRRLKDWYTAVAYTRLMDDGAIIICQTRWNVNDLSGWLLKEHKHEKWTVLNLPAINDQGEALWPEKYPLDVLHKIKKTLPERDWQALYQQKPFVEEGNIYKRQWWKMWPDGKPLPECVFIIQSYDTAFSDKERKQSSYSARVTLGVFKRESDDYHNVIVLERWKDRVEYPELRRGALEAYQDYAPDKVIIENKASGKSLVQDLRRAGLPLATYTPEKDKITRAYAAQSLLENGRCYYPARQWAEEFIGELARFPNPEDDDVADAFSQAIIWLQNSFLVAHSDDAKRRQREDEEEDLPDNVTRFKPKKRKASYG